MGILRTWGGWAASTIIVLLSVLATAPVATASPAWGQATDGVHIPLLGAQQPMLRTLYSSTALDAIANDIVSASDMKVIVEDDAAEWATLAGPESDRVLGFVYLYPPPSVLYHAIFLGPATYPAWTSWLASGVPSGGEYAFAVSAMSLVHESLHWRMLSGDEGAVNACALAFLPYYLERDFRIPQSIAQTTYVKVAVKTVKSVPVTRVVWKTKKVKVNGKWVTRRVRTTVTTLVSTSSVGYVTQPVTTNVPNPLYTTLLADAQDFYAHQPPAYNSGACPVSPPGTPAPAP